MAHLSYRFVAGSPSLQITLEFNIEQPMHALDDPMAARTPGDVERRRGDMVMRLGSIFGTRVGLGSSVRRRNSTIIDSSTGVSTVLLGLRGPMGASAVVVRDLHFMTVVRLRP